MSAPTEPKSNHNFDLLTSGSMHGYWPCHELYTNFATDSLSSFLSGALTGRQRQTDRDARAI